MSTTLSDKRVNIRKRQRCYSCFRYFEPGTEMRYWSGIYEGHFGSVYCCKTCIEIMDHCESDDDGGFAEGFVWEMMEKDQTPELLLETINKEKNVNG